MDKRHSVPFIVGIILPPFFYGLVGIIPKNVPAVPQVFGVSVSPTNTPLPPTVTSAPSPTLTPTPTKKPFPTRTPTPTPFPVTSEQLDSWFTQYSNHYSIERSKLWRMAVCESNLKPNARNGDYGGLFQFSTSTWKTTRRVMNVDPNPALRFNPEESIKTAAFKISTMGLSPWPNCNK